MKPLGYFVNEDRKGVPIPKLRWAIKKNPTVAVSQRGEQIFITGATDRRRRLRALYLDKPNEKDNHRQVLSLVVSGATRAADPSPGLICSDEAGECFFLNRQLHVNCGHKIVRFEGREMAEMPDHKISH